MADQTEGASSADIAGIVDDAAMRAAERDADELTLENLCMSLPEQPDQQFRDCASARSIDEGDPGEIFC
jgi:SpoVK/Ycf46/Vps4 family AAA+-type ATPase